MPVLPFRRTCRGLLIGVIATVCITSSAHGQVDPEMYLERVNRLLLSRIANLDYHPAYGLLIADEGTRTVWRIRTDGRVDSLCRRGQGPGEYEELTAVRWGPEGTIHIAGNSRIVTYTNEFEYLSWIRGIIPWDLEVANERLLFVAARMGEDGPVVMIEPEEESRTAVTEWRDPEPITGKTRDTLVSKAFLDWDPDRELLFICYQIDAGIEVVRGTEVIRRFTVPSETVERLIKEMREENRNLSGNIGGMISIALFSFCLADDGTLLVSVGSELVRVTSAGEVLGRAPWPEGYRQFYAGPAGYVFGIERDTMQLALFPLSDIFGH